MRSSAMRHVLPSAAGVPSQTAFITYSSQADCLRPLTNSHDGADRLIGDQAPHLFIRILIEMPLHVDRLEEGVFRALSDPWRTASRPLSRSKEACSHGRTVCTCSPIFPVHIHPTIGRAARARNAAHRAGGRPVTGSVPSGRRMSRMWGSGRWIM